MRLFLYITRYRRKFICENINIEKDLINYTEFEKRKETKQIQKFFYWKTDEFLACKILST